MSNVPHQHWTPEQDVSFGKFHAAVWSVILVLLLYAIVVEKAWYLLFLVYVAGLQIYVGVKSYKDGKRKLEARSQKEQQNGKA